MLNPGDDWFVFLSVFRKCGELLTVDPNSSGAGERRRRLYDEALAESKKLGDTGKPVVMLLDKMKSIAYPDSPATIP